MKKTIKVEIDLKRGSRKALRRIIYVDLKSNTANGVIKRLMAKYGLTVKAV